MSDPLAPHLKIVSIWDEAIDPKKFTQARATAYVTDYDPKHLEGVFVDGKTPTWFCITQLKQSTLSDEVDSAGSLSRKVKIAFLHCCHRIERPSDAMTVTDDELVSKKPKLAGDDWWDRCGEEFGDQMLHSIGVAILTRARLPKSKRSPLL